MELAAVIAAVNALKYSCRIDIYSDSKYVVHTLEKGWLESWKRRGWKKADKTQVLNRDLWESLDSALASHEFKFHWVKGHADNAENNRCDELAVAASKGGDLQIDSGYEADHPLTAG